MPDAPPFSPQEAERYARQIVLKGFGGAGQQALKRGSVLVVGAGGLGAPAIAYLAAAGIGRLGILDDDRVALSNLQRQFLFTDADLGTGKAARAADFAHAQNPHVKIDTHALRLTPDNAAGLVAGYDVVLDGSDTLETRRATAEACRAGKIALVSGAVSGFDGQVTVFAPHLERPDGRKGPDFRALYPETAGDADLPSCEAMGVVGPLTGVIGALMAMEAIKLVTGTGEPLIGRLLLYDGRTGRFTEMEI